MTLVHENLKPENILRITSALRSGDSPGSFCFNTAEQPLSGKQCHIFAVGFSDGTTWAIRVPVHTSHLPPGSITNHVDVEVEILRVLQERGFSWSPKLVAFDSGFDNPIGYPYIVLSWIHGKPLQWSDSVPAERKQRNKIIRRVMDIIIELANCTAYDTKVTAYQHLTELVDRKVCRVLLQQLPEIRLRDCFIHRALARMAIHPELDCSRFMISHDDLAPQNIIVDEHNDVKGIIDWGFARRLPMQFGLVYPHFLAIEPPVERNHPTPPDDPKAFSSGYSKPSAVLEDDRSYCLEYLSSLILKERMSKTILLNLSSPHVDWRRFIIDAASSKGLHKWMADRAWLFPGTEDEWHHLNNVKMLNEVDAFLEGIAGQRTGLNRESIAIYLQS